MFRACLTQSSRSVASSSSTPSSSLRLHTSAVVQAMAGTRTKKVSARITKKANQQKNVERQEAELLRQPSVILGLGPGEEHLWNDCDLAKIIVTEEKLDAEENKDLKVTMPYGAIVMPKLLAFGVGETEKKMLFENLPVLTAETALSGNTSKDLSPAKIKEIHDAASIQERLKANAFARILDLRNADGPAIAFENRKRIVEAFSPPGKQDPGSPEVQAAIMTYRIRNLWTHLNKFKRDVGNKRSIRLLIHKRQKVLRYLKNVDRDRYDRLLKRLALRSDSVEGELVV